MKRKVFRATSDTDWFEPALAEAEHILLKADNGRIVCATHDRDVVICLKQTSGDLVYQNSLDEGTFVLRVTRIAPYKGQLVLSRHGETVFSCEVGIMRDAPLGPETEDVRAWEELGTIAVEADRKVRAETPLS